MVSAHLDMYDYAFTYSNNKIIFIDVYLDSLVDIAGVSTDITGHNDRLYLDRKWFIRTKEEAIIDSGVNILRIFVKEIMNNVKRL